MVRATFKERMGATTTSPVGYVEVVKRARSIVIVLVALGVAPFAHGAPQATLHEPISVDPRDDITMGVVLEGDIPAAIETRSGVFSAPDPNRTPTSAELEAERRAEQESASSKFTPDRNTTRPDVLRYVDPFTPSTAPFKRLVAFDSVDSSFALYTPDRQTPMAVAHGGVAKGEDAFYADLAVDVGPSKLTRIPSVGPGARILHARLGVGARELGVNLVRDSADNWFLKSNEPANARLVMELAIPRATFGGEFGDPDWIALSVMPVPENVASAAREVFGRIGIGRQLRPAENVRKMVAYFRAFVDSDRPLEASKDVYTDLALSQKGVCRHRAYAFTITSLALGIPTRMVMNEAHAWVEVNDSSLWRRIDLGGAGRMLSEESKTAEPYAAPSDSFPWPANATRGEDLTEKAKNPNGNGGGGGGGGGGATPMPSPSGSAASNNAQPQNATAQNDPNDKRPASTVSIDVTETDAVRGTAVHVKGHAAADGSSCTGTLVNVYLRDNASKSSYGREARIGSAPTDSNGDFGAAFVLPSAVPVGDYEVVARTDGDTRCGRGASK